MRILMVTDFYWPFLGGVEQHVQRLSHSLAARGHSVAVATLQSGQLPEFELDGEVRIYRLRALMHRAPWLFTSPGRAWASPFPDPETTRQLRRIVRQEKPEIVHGHDWLARSFLTLKKGSKARFVMSLHYYTQSCAKKNLMYQNQPCSGPGLVKCFKCAVHHYGKGKGIPIVLSNWVMSAAERSAVDVFLPVSQATADGNGLKENDRYQVIPNFMPDEVDSTEDVGSYLAQLPRDGFLLFVGDLRRDKGLDVLLEAYAGLSEAPPLVLIGKVWAETPSAFPPNVILFKNWPNQAVLAAWKRSLMGIIPSIWPEPFGIVVIESMAGGCPVVASRIGGIPDIVNDGEGGILVPPGDVQALREAIERLLADPALRERMGQAARLRAAAFQASVVVPRIERVYEDILFHQPRGYEQNAPGEHYYQQL